MLNSKELKELLKSYVGTSDEDFLCDLMKKQHISTAVPKPSRVEIEITSLDAQLKEVEEELAVVETNNQQVQSENAKLHAEISELEKKRCKLLREKMQAESRNKQLLLETEMSPHDSLVMEKLIKKYKSFKLLTGIYWDYNEMDSGRRVKGYVCNRVTNSTHPFNLDATHSCVEQVWNEIEKCSHTEDAHLISKDKENATPN